MQAIQHAPSAPATLLAALHERGITASVAGTELRFNGPVGSLTADLKAAITEQGAGLMAALTGYAPLDEVIARDEARMHTTDQIQARLDHCRQMAEAPGAAPVWAQTVRDWTAILAAKERGTDSDGPPIDDEVSA